MRQLDKKYWSNETNRQKKSDQKRQIDKKTDQMRQIDKRKLIKWDK